MEDKEFLSLMEELNSYLEREKVFIKNSARFAEVQQATEIATKLFSDAKVTVEDDPLQMGALIVRIEGFDIIVRGKREIELFKKLISKADNFEIYSVASDKIRFAILFNDVLIRM
jgi:hypothetical protein